MKKLLYILFVTLTINASAQIETWRTATIKVKPVVKAQKFDATTHPPSNEVTLYSGTNKITLKRKTLYEYFVFYSDYDGNNKIELNTDTVSFETKAKTAHVMLTPYYNENEDKVITITVEAKTKVYIYSR